MTKILIVEDDAEGADAMRQYLEFRGFLIEVVSSGEAAVSALREGSGFDVVITDLHLPGIRGEDLALLLQAQRERPRLIALSGEHGSGARGPFDLRLPKPCRPRELVEAIGQVLRFAPPAT